MNVAINDIDSCIAACAELGPLTGLSMQHPRPGATPVAPGNEDRARAFRNAQPVALANHFHWPFQHRSFQQAGTGQAPASAAAAIGRGPGVPPPENAIGNRRFNLVRVA